jgi:adenylate cyclase class 2
MYEVELKVAADHDRVRARLDELGADSLGGVVQIDTYYDAPHRDFAETDEAFRLREERTDDGTTTRMTYKGPLVEADSKTREEFETAVGDGDTAADIVESLGFSPAATVRKDRQRYALDGFVVTLDDVESVGQFLEVETDVETESEVAAAREDAIDLLERLGCDPSERTNRSYLGMALAGDTQQ